MHQLGEGECSISVDQVLLDQGLQSFHLLFFISEDQRSIGEEKEGYPALLPNDLERSSRNRHP